MGVAAAVSLINMTSPVGIWSVINAFQMFLLLLLTGVFMPDSIRQYLTGMDFTLLSFSFIPLIKVPPFSYIFAKMKFEQQNNDLKDIGIEYESTIVNNIQL